MNLFSNDVSAEKQIDDFLAMGDIEIKILFSSENPALLGKTFKSSIHQITKEKLHLEVCRELVLNSVLDLSVYLKVNGKIYNLTGNVRSCCPLEQSDHYKVDIVFRERLDGPSDFKQWNKGFKKNFKNLLQ
ncbi:MAG: hypothetical protein OQL09_01935 [Gammaproteobacteria bacterium]|nr:hypothetical protein [Gammaproteobacteria bacterium]